MGIKIVALVLGLGILISGIGLSIISEKKKTLAILPSILGVILLLLGLSITIIPSGYVGVRTTYGQISDKPTKQGFNFSMPLVSTIHLVNCKQQEKTYDSLRVWSETSERTEVYFENITVNYQINSEYASWIWQNIEEWDTNLIKQTSVESGIKTASKQYTDIDVTDRSKIEKTAKECLQQSLNDKYGNQVVNILSINIGNINFSDAYNDAIEKKAQAKLAAETAEYENQKKIKEAEANAQEAKIKAQGNAEAKLIEAEAEAQANKKIAESLTSELVEKLKIEKWDGKLPIITGSNSPIINTDNLIKEETE